MSQDRLFEVGDRVVIRGWEDMADEFPEHNDDRIRVGDGCSFVAAMKHLCGAEGVIIGTYNNTYGHPRIKLDIDGAEDWSISPGMLRHADDATYKSVEVDRDQFIGFISGA